MSAEKRILERVGALADAYRMFPAGGTVLCAVSGGADSMALLYFLRSQANAYGFSLCACHFDHGLRPESGADAAFVRESCARWGIPLETTAQDVAARAAQRHQSTEEAGREMRYAWFERLAAQKKNCVIATAHNADDNAETLLLHLVRGAGRNGLGGIAPRRGRVIRPFLNVPRSLISEYIAERNIPFVEDATNADPTYTPRNLLRAEVMPVLRELNPALSDSLFSASASLRRDEEFLQKISLRVFAESVRREDGTVSLPVSCLTEENAIAARVLQLAAEELSSEIILTARQRQAVLDLCRAPRPSGTFDLPHGIKARRVYDKLILSGRRDKPVLPPTPLDFIGTKDIGPWRVAVQRGSPPADWRNAAWEFYLDPPLLLRPRKTGDRLRLPGRVGEKSVKEWMTEEKIPADCRDVIPVLERDGRPAGVCGLGTAEFAVPTPGKTYLHITISEKRKDAEP